MPSVQVNVLAVEDLYPALAEHGAGIVPRFEVGPPPPGPGVYVWDSNGSVLYIGSATSLAKRLGGYRKWIDGYHPEDGWEVSVIHMLKQHHGTVRWLSTVDHTDAKMLERRLIEWHRTCVGIAPLVTGWEAKAETPRGLAEEWSRSLWRKLNPSLPLPDDVTVARNARVGALRSAVEAASKEHGCDLAVAEILAVLAVDPGLKIDDAHEAAHALVSR